MSSVVSQRLGLFLFVSLVLLSAITSHAQNALKITNITGASHHVLGTGATSPIIYGGIQGDAAPCAAVSETSLCNNCIANNTACNRVRVHAPLYLNIEFTVNAETPAGSQVFFGYNNGGTTSEFTTYQKTTGTLQQGGTGFVKIRWDQLCNAASAGTSGVAFGACAWSVGVTGDDLQLYLSVAPSNNFPEANRTNITLRILAADGNPNPDLLTESDGAPSFGIYSFRAKPGDEKVYFDGGEDFKVLSTCPAEIITARVYFSTDYVTGLDAANYFTGNSVDLPLDANCVPGPEFYVDGLENDVTYMFRISLVDIAGNNIFLSNEIPTDCPVPGNAAGAEAADRLCTWYATPGKVIGLLPEDLNCFIATAAYGSPFHEKLFLLREFRNRFLLTSEFGRRFVKLYYSVGPAAAKVIAENHYLKKITQFLLAPVIGMAWFAMHYGLLGTVVVLISIIVMAVIGVHQIRRGEW